MITRRMVILNEKDVRGYLNLPVDVDILSMNVNPRTLTIDVILGKQVISHADFPWDIDQTNYEFVVGTEPIFLSKEHFIERDDRAEG